MLVDEYHQEHWSGLWCLLQQEDGTHVAFRFRCTRNSRHGYSRCTSSAPEPRRHLVNGEGSKPISAESATEVIHQRGAVIDISFTGKWPGHPNAPMQLRLTADGKPTRSTVGPNTFTSTTHWVDGKLVTFVEGDRGQHLTEIRELSPDGNTLTVTGYHQDELKKPYYVRVMTRRKF